MICYNFVIIQLLKSEICDNYDCFNPTNNRTWIQVFSASIKKTIDIVDGL
jgi:hypothetical protein